MIEKHSPIADAPPPLSVPTTELDAPESDAWTTVEAHIQDPSRIPDPLEEVGFQVPEGKVMAPLDYLRAGRIDPVTGKPYATEFFTPRGLATREAELAKATLRGELPDDDLAFKTSLAELAAATLPEAPKVVYNPGCGDHVSAATTFPEARTIFVDPDGDVEHRFVMHGAHSPEHPYEFYRADMREFTLPDGVLADLVLIFNAGYLTQEELDRVTHPGSVVAVNNWHGAVDYMRENCPGYSQREGVFEGENETLDLVAFRRNV